MLVKGYLKSAVQIKLLNLKLFVPDSVVDDYIKDRQIPDIKMAASFPFSWSRVAQPVLPEVHM